jgi:hypothetical protein
MSKRQLIDDIRRYNNTAQPTFLAQFEEPALKQYLEHLESARLKHLRYARLVAGHHGPKVRMAS